MINSEVIMTSEREFHSLSDEKETLVQGEFVVYHGKHSNTVQLSVFREKIVYSGENGTKPKVADCVALSDVVGCRSLGGSDEQGTGGSSTAAGSSNSKKNKTNPKLTGIMSCLQLFAYRYNKKPANGGVRRRLELNFYCNRHETKEENVAHVERWVLLIQCLLKGVDFASIDDLTSALLPTPPHYLVCINPSSGKGKAGQIFRQQVQPVFEEAAVTFKTITTERQGHGFEIATQLDLKTYSGIIIVSGDGLLYEFIQGFKERGDREEAFKIPFGLIPGGSGNALCAAVLSVKGEQLLKNEALHAAFCIVKGKAHPKDMVHVQNQEASFFAFLSVAWGIIADVDIESERFRFMGETRFTVGAVTRIAFLRKVPGRLSFLPVADESKYAHLLQKKNAKRSSETSKAGGGAVGTNGLTEAHAEERTEGKNRNQNSNPDSTGAGDAPRHSLNAEATEPLELPPLSQPVPSDWTVIEGDFVTVVMAFMSHLSRDFLTHPGRMLDEGVITLHYMDGSTTRGNLVKLFDEVKTGEYMSGDYTRVRFIRAFRLEPLSEDGILTVDGERVKFGPIQGSMMSLKCQCIV